MNGKSGITITRNHSEINVIKMKHQSVVKFGKSRMRPDKYQHILTWSVVRTVPAYSNTTIPLCLHEKLEILMNPDPEELLNKRSKVVSRCPHERKYLLSNDDSKD